MESAGELTWFRNELIRSITRPRSFARSLAREHYGLAGVLVALAGGFALSLTVDAFVLVSKGAPPQSFVARVLLDAFLLGVRVDIVVTVIATVVWGALRLIRAGELTLDQIFTALAFALSPLILAPVGGLIALAEPSWIVAGGLVVALIVMRVAIGVVLNVAAVLPVPLAALAVLLVALGAQVALGDQLSRIRMTAYVVEPALAPRLAAAPATGRRYELDAVTLTVPTEWVWSVRGLTGEIAHFETATATLNVVRGRAEPLATMDSFADQLARPERLGFTARRDERRVVRIGEQLALEDRADGTYEGRHVALDQLTVARASGGVALHFRFFDPTDLDAVFAQAEAIAVTLELGSR